MLTRCPQKSSLLGTLLLVDTTVPSEMSVVAHDLVPEASLIGRKTPICGKYTGNVSKFDHSDFSVVSTSVCRTSRS